MKTFLKMILSAIILNILLIFCSTLPAVVLCGVVLFYIWDDKEGKKEIKKEVYENE